ncbi:GNAT family N-acetyltransferase [Catellatospora tritici]|uniref:GNAT family N-acetyltransferase n=1 Tax=Catellatospora tritici TaxID=2851566 RepID=UPI001C2D9912|nr:GNAT family N-acetyltransferase [Catellatospora tritici]MBV1848776.1 GNAT family N-acetyltransferase [Catellatospora tritici]
MTEHLDPDALLVAYDAQLRAHVPPILPAGVTVEHDGPVTRMVGFDHGGFVTYRDVSGLDSAELDALIARQRDYFAARGERVEWKLHGHDLPADLSERLVAAGFEPEEPETVVIGLAAPLAQPPVLPEGVTLREVNSRADLDRIAAMEEAVWNEGRLWLAEGLEKEIAADPDSVTVVVAEAGGEVVSAGWIRYVPGTDFAGLWGGSTLAQWRGRGIYKALVAYRAIRAIERGYSYLQVDASPDSRPILNRLGLISITTTTPYVWSPPTDAAAPAAPVGPAAPAA